MKRIINFLKKKYIITKHQKTSFSQCGEDLIIRHAFSLLGIPYPTFMDIGAFEPYFINNTAMLYEAGCRGINIEPNLHYANMLKKFRPEDITLHAGIGIRKELKKYYMFNKPTLNTFSEEDAQKAIKEGAALVQTHEVHVFPLPDIISEYCNNQFPDFLNIDVEGMEMEILKQIDFSSNYPKIICAETVVYSENKNFHKRDDIMEYLKNKNYLVFADTSINTIFIRKDVMQL